MSDNRSSATDDSVLAQPLKIGSVVLQNRAFLAPMSGVTDVVFRRLAWRFGAGLVFSEMVASEALVEGETEMATKALPAGFAPHAVQLAGREAHWMALAARMAQDNGADIIDINMGCPAKRVTTGYAGSALMRDPDHALSLVEAVVGVARVPVTLKMRLGWDHGSINAPQIARRAQEAGVAMITVHGRTRCQFYEGSADWGAVRAVREAVNVPLVVNGDVGDRASADLALAASGADAVMAGRACYGAPWLAGVIAASPRAPGAPDDPAFVAQVACEHYDGLLTLYGRESGLRQARKHVAWYLDAMGVAPTSPLRRAMLTTRNPQEVLSGLEHFGAGGNAAEAA